MPMAHAITMAVSTLGISLGGLVHVTAAVFGVSAILMSSSLAFSVVKYAGAAYLVYLGVKTLASRDDRSEPSAPESTTHGLRRAFLDGVIVNTLNPKAALFFFAIRIRPLSFENHLLASHIQRCQR